MKISLITATYNSAANISTAITSLNEQSYPNIEWIIVDGASKDNTVELVKAEFKGNLRVISERDCGIYDALNKGVKIATGDIIGFLHSDDLFATKDTIENIMNVFNQEKTDGIYGDLQYVDKDNTSKVIRYWKSEKFHTPLLNKGWMPAHPTLFLKREVYEKHGSFNTIYKIAADYDLMLRIFGDKKLTFKYIPEVITKMRVGGASNRSLKNIKLKSTEDFRALKANGMKNPLKILAYKNLSKLQQFVSRKRPLLKVYK